MEGGDSFEESSEGGKGQPFFPFHNKTRELMPEQEYITLPAFLMSNEQKYPTFYKRLQNTIEATLKWATLQWATLKFTTQTR